jgi:hypothetical protein
MSPQKSAIAESHNKSFLIVILYITHSYLNCKGYCTYIYPLTQNKSLCYYFIGDNNIGVNNVDDSNIVM